MKRRKALAIIVDLDGTLYDCKGRREKFMGDKKYFDAFHAAAKHDPSHQWCVQLCKAMRKAGYSVLFVSGRDEPWRADTEWWLYQELGWKPGNYELHMRPAKDSRKDSHVKQEIYKKVIEPRYSVLFTVDDRQQVVDMWRSLGLTCLQCAVGDF